MSALVLMLLVVPSGEDMATRAQTEFDAGLSARLNGEPFRHHFRNAADAYEQLRQQGSRNADLECNLGNSYLLAGDLPQAILAYRRGQRYDPAHRGLRTCLGDARKQVLFLEGSTLGRAPETMRPVWLPHAPITLFAIAALFYVFFCAALMRWWMLRRGRWLMIALLALVLAVGASMLLVVSIRAIPSRPVVVVARNAVQLRKGDGWSFPPRFEVPLNRGVEAGLLHRQNGWLQIELSGGEVGWIAETDAVVEE